LGSANTFAVLGGSAVTNIGPTTLTGDLGVYPGSSIVPGAGFTFLSGAEHNTPPGGDPVSFAAHNDLVTAYGALAALPATGDLTGQVLGTGGTVPTLTPGVYTFASTAALNGTLTLDFQNRTNAGFVFLVGTALTTASSSSVVAINDPGPSDAVFWLLGVTGGAGTGSATLLGGVGTPTTFIGNILALDAITLGTTSSILCGRALAQFAAVSLDNNVINNGALAGACGSFGLSGGETSLSGIEFSSTDGNGGGHAVPAPSTFLLLGSGLAALAGVTRRRHRRT
jgi:type VI secretion system secreted protein VgrG